MATDTINPATTIDGNPNKTLDLTTTTDLASEPNTNPDITPLSSTVDSDSATNGVDDSKTTTTETTLVDAAVTNVEKKIRRAERFGMPVKLSEEEKRNTRAERFGTAPTTNKSETNKSETSKSAEELKRKARAERFGLPVPAVASEEKAKKKSRLERFSPYPKPDQQEEDKRKARALRFSTPSSKSLSEANGKENIEKHEQTAAIAGKAGGGS